MEAQGLSTQPSIQHGFSVSQFLEEDYYNQLPMFEQNSPWNIASLPYRSREPSVPAPEPSKLKRPSPQDWHNIRPVFTKLYSTEDKTLKDVKSILERDHGFVAKYTPNVDRFPSTY
jgi:Clr5 domain